MVKFITLLQWCTCVLQDSLTSLPGVATGAAKHTGETGLKRERTVKLCFFNPLLSFYMNVRIYSWMANKENRKLRISLHSRCCFSMHKTYDVGVVIFRMKRLVFGFDYPWCAQPIRNQICNNLFYKHLFAISVVLPKVRSHVVCFLYWDSLTSNMNVHKGKPTNFTMNMAVWLTS